MTKRIDSHFHVIGRDADFAAACASRALYWYPNDNPHWIASLSEKVIANSIREAARDLGLAQQTDTDSYWQVTLGTLRTSNQIDGIVLLAMDAFWDGGEQPLLEPTDIWVPNRYLWARIELTNQALAEEGSDKRLLFGASVSPRRPEAGEQSWRRELDWVTNQTDAVLLKLIPSVHGLRLEEVPQAFWAAVAASELPMLIHVGGEYAFPEGLKHPDLDLIEHIQAPLDAGVTVIVAHCAAPMFLGDRQGGVDQLCQLMERYNRNGQVQLWADTAALTMAGRAALLRRICQTIRSEWILHGSDFPVPVDAWAYWPWVGGLSLDEFVAMRATKNRLDRDVIIKLGVGFSEATLTNATRPLRMSPALRSWSEA